MVARIACLTLLGVSGVLWHDATYSAEPPASVARLGINLSGPADWNTELPFVDLFRMSRPWISQRRGSSWGKGPELGLDPHGWVKFVEPDCWAETPCAQARAFPAGRYTVLYEGNGTLVPSGGAGKIVESAPGRLVLEADAAKGAFFLQLRTTDPQNYVKNIRVLAPGTEPTAQANPFHPAFLKRWQGVACIRFMDWMHTNGSKIAKWADRPALDDATFSKKGVALEWMIELCNQQKADPWFCMPHRADDDYVRQFATMVKQRLAADRKVYIEYSNEVWNSQFEQSRYAGQEGVKLELSPAARPWEAAWHYTAYRSVQIFHIWQEVFGGKERLVRVLPSQAAGLNTSREILTFRDAYREADALAIAPYLSMIATPGGKLDSEAVAGWNLDKVFDYLRRQALPQSTKHIQDHAALARQYGLKLIAYEAGQHLVGARGGENNEALTRLFMAANADKRMGQIYDQYFAAWKDAGGDLLCHFSSVGTSTKWGSWGLLQKYNDDEKASPKFQAVARWAKSLGQPLSVPSP